MPFGKLLLKQGRGWAALSAAAALLVITPIIALAFVAADAPAGGQSIWPHLMAFVLPQAITDTALLLAGVGVLTMIIGTSAAWLVCAYDFPGRKVLDWALLLPLAVPTYIVAYAYLDLLHPVGPVQTVLRAVLGIENPQDLRLPDIRSRLDLDFVVMNGENAAAGFGITQKLCEEFYAAGVDAITTGNHVWGQREIVSYIGNDPRLLRPQNFPRGTPGRGVGIYEARRGRKVMVMNVMTRVFMEALDDPFTCIEEELTKVRLGATVDAILLDVHGEASSEKNAIGVMVDGRVSLVVGTHTHVPTADWRVLPGGTAYQTDAGMCGDYDSIIGMDKEEPLARFRHKLTFGHFTPALGEGTICGTYVETDDRTGLATYIAPLHQGGKLAQAWPIPSNRDPA